MSMWNNPERGANIDFRGIDHMKTFKKSKNIDVSQVENFINEIESVCKKHNMTIESQDSYCGLTIHLKSYDNPHNPHLLKHSEVRFDGKYIGRLNNGKLGEINE